MGRKSQTLEKLLSNTTPDGWCLRWNGCKDKDGYGISSIKGVKMPAHRAVMSFLFDVSNQYVLHTCTNRDCVNPEHLYLGDQQQNVQDQIDVGTFVYGSKNGMAKLNEMSVEHIRSSSFSMKSLAKYYDVSYYTIWDIKRNRTWKQVK
jgi:hypothetical protein